MIRCTYCGRIHITSYEEKIKSCPYCASDSHHIYYFRKGFMPTYNKKVMALYKKSHGQPFGACFITPRGYIVPVRSLRFLSQEEKEEAEREEE